MEHGKLHVFSMGIVTGNPAGENPQMLYRKGLPCHDDVDCVIML
jgi:hypothetical protein